jgi:hypothetical protein
MAIQTETPTQAVLKKMLRENTGSHMLDSGGAYGRYWERNQNIDFDSVYDSAVKFELGNNGEIWPNVTHDLYHWLSEVIEYIPEFDKQFQEYLDSAPAERGWLELMKNWPSVFNSDMSYDPPGGLYGDSDGPMTVNTYNHDSCLSQVIQYIYWTCSDTDDEYMVLQIHNGCDVRGGYTRPRMFRTWLEGNVISFLDDNRYGISCDHCSAIWENENGPEWNGSDYLSHCVPDFGEISGIEGDKDDAMKYCADTLNRFIPPQSEKLIDVSQTKQAELPEDTKLVVKDGEAFCPVCGEGKLKSHFY